MKSQILFEAVGKTFRSPAVPVFQAGAVLFSSDSYADSILQARIGQMVFKRSFLCYNGFVPIKVGHALALNYIQIRSRRVL